jgi:hypothetical protein
MKKLLIIAAALLSCVTAAPANAVVLVYSNHVVTNDELCASNFLFCPGFGGHMITIWPGAWGHWLWA